MKTINMKGRRKNLYINKHKTLEKADTWSAVCFVRDFYHIV